MPAIYMQSYMSSALIFSCTNETIHDTDVRPFFFLNYGPSFTDLTPLLVWLHSVSDKNFVNIPLNRKQVYKSLLTSLEMK